LFQTATGKTGKAMWQQDACRMIQRHTRGTGIRTRIGNHSFRATGGKTTADVHPASHCIRAS